MQVPIREMEDLAGRMLHTTCPSAISNALLGLLSSNPSRIINRGSGSAFCFKSPSIEVVTYIRNKNDKLGQTMYIPFSKILVSAVMMGMTF